MSTLTAHLSLKKPELTDTVSPEDFNDNFDVLDNEIYDTKKMIEWKQTGSAVTGKADIQLPASWNEVIIVTQVRTPTEGFTKQLWTVTLPKSALTVFVNGSNIDPLRLTSGGSSTEGGFHADYDVYKALNKVRLARVFNKGVDVTSTCITRVYYR